MRNSFAEDDNENADKINSQSAQLIITKFLKKGFEGLALEDLAVAQMVASFPLDFQKQTGLNWTTKYEIKALERLNRAKFDLQWMARRTNNLFDFLFVNINKGDLDKVKDFCRKCDESLIYAVDDKKRSPLHLAAKSGFSALVEFFILKGFNVNARDRLLKTPLHYSCQFGNEVATSLLLKNGADLEAKDSHGRSSFLYACMGNSTQIITLLLSTCPEHILTSDRTLRNALHYAIFNNSNKQIEIVRTLLEHKCPINAADEEGLTPLHLAAEAGKSRVIPVLLKGGADLGLREKKNHKTAMELALNDRTREMIVVYGTTPHQVGEEEREWMDKAIKGSKVVVNKPFEVPVHPPAKKILPYEEESNSIISLLRNQFFTFMKKIQENGVETYQHLKKPYLYTGSWMEGVATIDELYERLKDLNSIEAVLRVFNILCPYDKKLPVGKGEEDILDNWYSNNPGLTSNNSNGKNVNPNNQKLDEAREKALNNALDIARNNLKEKEIELTKIQELLKTEQNKNQLLKDLEYELEIFKKDASKNEESFKSQLKASSDKQKLLTDENSKLLERIKDLDLANESKKKLLIANKALESENSTLKAEIESLTSQLSSIKSLSKVQRAKTGQFFLDIISNLRTVPVQKNEKEKNDKADGLENLEDDDSIIKLYQSLKGNPPSMAQRLRDVDADGDGMVIQTEFRNFLDKLKISPQDIEALCRVAGYMSGKVKLGIEEWRKILEERPKLREIWEKELFKRVLRAIKAKNLSVERLFNLIDVDNDDQVTPEELRIGLESLKIILNPRDFANMFKIFDKDGSARISLDEMRSTLDYYEKQAGSEDLNHDFDERFIEKGGNDDYDEKISSQKLKISNQFTLPQKLLEGDNLKINGECIGLIGDLKIQIPYGEGLENIKNLKEIVIRIRLKGVREPEITRGVLLLDSNNWMFAVKVGLRGELAENLGDSLNIQIYSNMNFEEKSFLGELDLDWKTCLGTPESWIINNEFALKAAEKYPNRKIVGIIGVQVRYIPSTSKDFKSKLFENEIPPPPKKTFLSQTIDEGMLEVSVLSCIINEPNIKLEPKIILKLPSMDPKNLKCKSFDEASQIALFGDLTTKEMKIQSQINLECIQVKLLWNDKTNIELFINWEENLLYPCHFLSQKSFLFKMNEASTTFNKLYLKIRWIPKSEYKNLTNNFSGKTLKNDQLTADSYFYGTLKLLIVRAKKLSPADCDPYCKIIFEGGDKPIEQKTKVIKKDPNPNWGELLVFDVKFLKDCLPPLRIQVIDANFFKDEVIGTASISFSAAVEKPTVWAIDELFKLRDKTGKEGESQVYIQINYVPQNTFDPNPKPIDKENRLSMAKTEDIIGNLHLHIVHARGLKTLERNSLPDPYCQIILPDNSELKTETISSSTNPIWNSKHTIPLKLTNEQYKPFKIILKDSNFFTDALLGFVDVNWKSCLEKRGSWAINEIFKISGTPDLIGNLSSLGYLYVQMKFLDLDMKDDQTSPKSLENLPEMLSLSEGLYKGFLRIFLVSARLQLRASYDAKVVFKPPGGVKVVSEIVKSSTPVWKKIYNISINSPRSGAPPLKIEVLDDHVFGDKPLGFCLINLAQVFEKPGEWEFNEVVSLERKEEGKKEVAGSIYMQIMFAYDLGGEPKRPLALKEDVEEEGRKKKEEEEKMIKGILKVNIVFARGLKKGDDTTSDPYCVVKYPDGSNISTKVIEKTLEPIWNFEHPKMINIKQKEYKPLEITVYDKDALKDDVLGFIKADWQECVKNPGLWMVNNVFSLQGESQFGSNLGEIYLQMRFDSDEIEKAPNSKTIQLCKTLPPLIPEYGRIVGRLYVDILSAENLQNCDLTGKSDPFCRVFVNKCSERRLETPPIQETLAPVWNLKGGFLFIDLRRKQCNELALIAEIYDEDVGSSEFMGSGSVELAEIIEKNDENWVEEGYPIIFKGKTMGNVKLGLKWVADGGCEMIEGLGGVRYEEGEVGVRIMECRLGKKMIFNCICYLSSDGKMERKVLTKQLVSTDKNDEKLAIKVGKIRMDSLINDKLIITLDEKGIFGDKLGCSIPIKSIIESPGSWINEILEIFDKKGERNGWMSLQAQYRPKNNDFTAQILDFPLPKDFSIIEEKLKKEAPKILEGTIIINFMGAQNLFKSDIETGSSDPFCSVSYLLTKAVIKTAVIKKNLNPIWSELNKTIEISAKESDVLCSKLSFRVYDDDFLLKDLLGEVEYSVKTIVDKPGEWINELLPLFNPDGFPLKDSRLYLQLLWCPKGQKPSLCDLPDLLLQERLAQEEAKKDAEEKKAKIPKKSGHFLINIICARGLKDSDMGNKSDPFCEISLNKATNKITTKIIEDNLNPEWNLMNQKLDLALPEPEFIDLKLKCIVYDKDITSDDILGYSVIDLAPFINDPGKWHNDFIPLTDEIGGNSNTLGRIYIQFQWRFDDANYDHIQPPEILKNPIEKPKEPVLDRYLQINIIKAQNLKVGDFKSSDAFTKGRLNKGNPKPIQTKVITSLNPVWNFSETLKMSLPLREYPETKLILEVYDEDFPSGNDFLGKVVVELADLFNSNLKILEKGFLLMNEECKATTKGEIFLKLVWSDSEPENQQKNMEGKGQVVDLEPEKKLPPNEKGKVNGILQVKLYAAKNLTILKKNTTVYAHFKLYQSSIKSMITKNLNSVSNPLWNHEENLSICFEIEEMKKIICTIDIFENQGKSNECIGKAEIDLTDLVNKNPKKNFRSWHQIKDNKNKDLGESMIESEFCWRPR